MRRLLATSDSIVPLVLRLALGIVMFPHGAQKVLGWWGGGGFSGTIQGMGQMGMPAVVVVLVMMAEFLGSLGLIVGFLTRVSAAGIGLVMAGAIVLVHLKNGFFMNWYGNQAGEGYEYHLLAIGLAVALVIAGGGKASVDGAIAKGMARG